MKRILIIKLSALGDVLIASAALRNLIEKHFDAQIHLLTSPSYKPLFETWPDLDIVCLTQANWASVGRLGWQLRTRRYQRVYDLQGNKRSRVLTWLSGAPERIGLWRGWPYTQGGRLPRSPRIHPQVRLNSVLQAVDAANIAEHSPIVVSAQARRAAEQWLLDHDLTNKELVLIHAGCSARWHSKRWREPYFGELAMALQNQGYQIIWVGGPDDRALNTRLAQQVGLNASEAFSIPVLIALARHARFAIANDSAPMHAMAAANIPVYSLFGPTDWRLSHAIGQQERVIHTDVSCSPCFQATCPLKEDPHRCMSQIEVADVMARLRSDGLFAADQAAGRVPDTGARSSSD